MPKKKILMVDDETDYTSITKIFIEDAGDYEVHVVNQGSQGYPTAKAVKPDIILLDVSMPQVSGYQVADQLGQDPELKDIPIVFFTGVYQEVNPASKLLHGHPYLTKPTSGEQLIAFIEQCLSKKKTPE